MSQPEQLAGGKYTLTYKGKDAFSKPLNVMDLKPVKNVGGDPTKLILEKLTQDLTDLKVANPRNLAKQIVDASQGDIETLVRVMLFLDTTTPVGQFAHFWQGKVITGVYIPERIVEMDISEMLPEVFLSPTVADAKKASLLADIQKEIDNQTANIDKLLDPFGRRNQKVGANIQVPQVVPIRELCENITNVDEVNMIICKQDSKFYCLDIDMLLFLLAQDKPVINYLTNKPLPAEIVSNLKRRYGSQVIGNAVFVDLHKMLTNVQNTTEADLLFMPLEDLAGERLAAQNFQFISNCEKCDKDALLKEIRAALLTIKNGGKIAVAEKTSKKAPQATQSEQPQAPQAPQAAATAAAGPQAIVVELLTRNTATKELYDRYLNRAENIVQTILEKLRTAKDTNERNYLNGLLKRANEEKGKISKAATDRKKIKDLIMSERGLYVNKIKVLDNAGGISAIFDNDKQIAEQSRINWQMYVDLLDAEMALL